MKAHRRCRVIGGQRHATAALPPRKRPVTNSVGGWMGPEVCLDRYGKSRPLRGSITGPSCPQQVGSCSMPSIYLRAHPRLLSWVVSFCDFWVSQSVLCYRCSTISSPPSLSHRDHSNNSSLHNQYAIMKNVADVRYCTQGDLYLRSFIFLQIVTFNRFSVSSKIRFGLQQVFWSWKFSCEK